MIRLRWLAVCAAMVLSTAWPQVLAAQSADRPTTSGSTEGTEAPAVEPRRGAFWAILGRTPDRRRAIGMWAMHPFEPTFPAVEWTRGFGTQFSTWFFATFVNSYGERAFVAGIERNWFEGAFGPLRWGGGYRTGVVTGYDERLLELADKTPVLPFIGALAWSQVGRVGVDAYYVYRAITLEASLRF